MRLKYNGKKKKKKKFKLRFCFKIRNFFNILLLKNAKMGTDSLT